jgi:hypothetical protein
MIFDSWKGFLSNGRQSSRGVPLSTMAIASLLFHFGHKFPRPALLPLGCHVGRAIARLPADG